MTSTPGAARERPRRPPPAPPAERPLMLLLAAGLVLAAEVGTQYVAWRFGFHPALGRPLVILSDHAVRLWRAAGVLGLGFALATVLLAPLRRLSGPLLLIAICAAIGSLGPIYPPYRLFLWYARAARVHAALSMFRGAWILVLLVALASTFIILRAWHRPPASSPSGSHGTAQWDTGETLHRETGLLLGRQGPQLLRFGGDGHLLTVAPTRSGKGVSAVIPNLLDHPGSVLVTDPKGENYAVTAGWRRKMGQAVHAFDPFGGMGGKATYNPLDLIDATSPEAVDDARMLADMLVLPGVREGDQAFWNEEARGLLTALILHVAASAPPEHRTLTRVRTLLSLAPEPFADLLKHMQASEAAEGLVARGAARLLQKAEKERSGVLSTAQSHTHFLDSPRMAEVLGRSTVNLSTLKREAASVYLILPTERMDGYARWLRLMIACALLAMTRTRGQPAARVLFLLDEFAHLGRMAPVQQGIGLAGGFGVTFWLIVQDLSQLRSAYGESWSTFVANGDVLQAFGIHDWDTAEYLSRMTGDATIVVESESESLGESQGPHGHGARGASRTRSERGRRLLLPDEVLRLPREVELLFVKGEAPLLVHRLNYLRDREFRGRANPNPLYDRVKAAG